jgi:hypothetical protein
MVSPLLSVTLFCFVLTVFWLLLPTFPFIISSILVQPKLLPQYCKLLNLSYTYLHTHTHTHIHTYKYTNVSLMHHTATAANGYETRHLP